MRWILPVILVIVFWLNLSAAWYYGYLCGQMAEFKKIKTMINKILAELEAKQKTGGEKNDE